MDIKVVSFGGNKDECGGGEYNKGRSTTSVKKHGESK